jgi:hypothetical protein
VFKTKVVEKIKTHISCSEIRAVYEMWKNIVEPNHNACWIPKATNTLADYVMFITLPLQQ